MEGHSSDQSDQSVVDLANELLQYMSTDLQVTNWRQIDHQVFVALYEGLCAETLKDKITHPKSDEEEAHNIQAVIDAISMDIVNASLSHITGESIVRGDQTAVQNLLDVFSWMLEYILERISHDGSEKDLSEVDEDDPDCVTSQYLDELLEKELSNGFGNGRLGTVTRHEKRISNKEQITGDSTADYIALGNQSGLSQKSGSMDNTAELIALGHHSNQATHKHGSTESTSEEDLIRRIRETSINPTTPHIAMVSPHKAQSPNVESHTSSPPQLPEVLPSTSGEDHNTLTNLSSSLPLPNTNVPSHLKGLAATFPSTSAPRATSANYGTLSNPHQAETERGVRRAQSYEGLVNMMNDTVSMTRAAVSPGNQPHDKSRGDRVQAGGGLVSHGGRKQTNVSLEDRFDTRGDVETQLSKALSKTLERVHQESEVLHNVSMKKENLSYGDTNNSHGGGAKDKAKRKVSFLNSRSSDDISLSSCESPTNISNNARFSERQIRSDGYIGDITGRKGDKDNSQNGVNTFDMVNRNGELVLTDRACKVAEDLEDRRKGNSQFPPDPNRIPQTFDEYLEKYHGVIERRDLPRGRDDDVEAGTSGQPTENYDDLNECEDDDNPAVKYKQRACGVSTGLSPGQMHKRLNVYGAQSGKSVRFDDAVDEMASRGPVEDIRRQIARESKQASNRTQEKFFMHKVYKKEIKDFEQEVSSAMKEMRLEALTKEMEYKQKILEEQKSMKRMGKPYNEKGTKKSKIKTIDQRFNAPTPNLRIYHNSLKTAMEGDLMPWLVEEFPYLHLSQEMLHSIWRKSANQIDHLTQVHRDLKTKKGKDVLKFEAAEKRKDILLKIIKREFDCNRRLKIMRERRYEQQLTKRKILDHKLLRARSKKYYNEFQVRMRSKMAKKKSREELMFKKIYENGLTIQKERIRSLRVYARESKEKRDRRQRDEMASLENFYQDKLSMLAECLAKEKLEIGIRERSQAKVMDQVRRELRANMEKEIVVLQDSLYRDEDEEFHRQLDADRLHKELMLSRYAAKM